MVKFVLLCHARTGSTLLVDTLERHPAVRMYGEVFSPSDEDRRTLYHVDGRPWQGEDGADFVREVIYRERVGIDAIGFKYLYYHADEPRAASALDHLAASPDVRAILLTRDDLLATLVSLECASRSGVWQAAADPQPTVPLEPFRIEREHCERFFRRIIGVHAQLRARFERHALLELEYSTDIETGFAATLARVQAFLGVDARPLEPALQKLPARRIHEQVANFEELARELAGTPYARWFARAR